MFDDRLDARLEQRTATALADHLAGCPRCRAEWESYAGAWTALARRLGKKQAWLAAMAVNTGAFAGVFFLGPGDAAAYGVLVFLSGIGFGATLAIPSAMQADVIDYDELLSGRRREGQYIGLWSIAKKTAAALGIGVGLTVLGDRKSVV